MQQYSRLGLYFKPSHSNAIFFPTFELKRNNIVCCLQSWKAFLYCLRCYLCTMDVQETMVNINKKCTTLMLFWKTFLKQKSLLGLNGAIARKHVVIRWKHVTMELKLKCKTVPIFHNAVCIICVVKNVCTWPIMSDYSFKDVCFWRWLL